MNSYQEYKDYFARKQGFGVLSTVGKDGRIDSAVYAAPLVFDEGLAFIMSDRLSHSQVAENPAALFLFKEDGNAYEGKRLSLRAIREESDDARIERLLRESYPERAGAYAGSKKYLVFFQVEHARPLIGEK